MVAYRKPQQNKKEGERRIGVILDLIEGKL